VEVDTKLTPARLAIRRRSRDRLAWVGGGLFKERGDLSTSLGL
jgi:hypothetical protein